MNRCAWLACMIVALICMAPASGDNGTAWPFEIKTEHRPGTYWWCPGSAFDEAGIDYNLEAMQEAGIGTAHIVPIYGAKGYEDRYIEYLSPEWLEMLDYCVKKAASLDMNIDMTTGTGWCFGGPGLRRGQGDEIAVYDRKKKTLSFEPGRMVKRAAPGGRGPMLNPYSPAAMDAYLKRFSDAFDRAKPSLPRAQYHDSFEYKGDWSPELFAAFKSRRGYDLADHLDAFFTGEGDKDWIARLKCDYRATLAELHYEFITKWMAWAKGRGMLTRNQAHGAPANLLDCYAAADIPETEFFGAPDYPIPGFRRNGALVRPGDNDPRITRMASSAAHIAHPPGKQWVASESCTWLRDHWNTTLGQMKLELDDFFLAGVNHLFYHGTCYSPEDAPWPGWFFYASTKVDPRNSIWRDFRFLNGYAARCQSILQPGHAANDVLLYWPIHDLWTDPEGTVQKLTVHNPKWMTGQRVGAVAQELIGRGYAFDFVSDSLLQRIEAREGALHAPGGAYHAVVVPACRYMPVASLRHLADLAEGGGTVLFENGLPEDVPGLGNLEARSEALAVERQRLELAGALVVPDIHHALEAAKVPRETLVEHDLRYIRREVDGTRYYFIANQTSETYDGWLRLAHPFQSATLLDPMSGTSGLAATRQKESTGGEVYVQLQSGETIFIRINGDSISAPAWTYLKESGDALVVNGPWRIDFIAGAPQLPAPYETAKLASWTEAPDEKAQAFAGTAKYTVAFALPETVHADEWLLDLGDVRESARVRVNGHDAATVFALPFRLRVGQYVQPGENRLEIEVTNLTANRIRDLGQRGVNYKIMNDINIVNVDYKAFEPGKWPLAESGLLGPIRLLPMKRIGR